MTITLADLATLEQYDVRTVLELLPSTPIRSPQPRRLVSAAKPVDLGPSYSDWAMRNTPTAFSWTVSVWCALVFAVLVAIFLIGFWHGISQAWHAGTAAVRTLQVHHAAGMPPSSLINPGQ